MPNPGSKLNCFAHDRPIEVYFSVRLTLRNKEDLTAGVILRSNDGVDVFTPVTLVMGKHARFSGGGALPYFRRRAGNVFHQRGSFTIRRRTLNLFAILKAEAGFLLRARRAGVSEEEIKMRLATLRRQSKMSCQTWLLADHKSEGGDNGEALFRHLCASPSEGVDPCFVLRKEAKVFKELNKLGKVVEPNSEEHLQLFIDSQVVLNSAGDEYMVDPLGGKRRMINDLIGHRSVFLQHGVTKDDQSAWLNRYQKGFDMFLSTAAREKDALVNGAYGYAEDQILLTGMPRFDLLKSSPDRLVVFAPTWRKSLSGQLNKRTGRVGPSHSFLESSYAAFWQQVLLNPDLNEALLRRGFRGVFALHPSHTGDEKSFKVGAGIKISSYPHDYKRLFETGSVLVTDYSSVAFDFAYLRKPVIYAQGDRKEFFDSHLYDEGYFSYEDDGFGPVTESIDELVSAIVSLVSGTGSMEEKYLERANNFFAFRGGGNSKRLQRAVATKLESPRE